MSLFFITFFLVYGSMHLYAFIRARAALQFGTQAAVCIALFMGVMFGAPFLIRVSERYGMDLFARLLSYAGYTWLGVLFLFCSCSILFDVWTGAIRVAGLLSRYDLVQFTPSAGLRFFPPLVISLLLAGYGYFEALDIRTEHITIRTTKLPDSIGKVRIVQISDVHIGLIVREERLKRVLGKVMDEAPDILVSTGDLVDGQINGLPGLGEMFYNINPRFGKYAITGNHEYYAGLEQALGFIRKSGFRVLRNEAVDISGVLNIAGVDDRAVRPWGITGNGTEKEILSRLPREKFTLFLKHRPLVDPDAAGLFDLQLSGHVHKGQIFPFSILTRLYYPVDAGYAVLGKGSHLYVSRGTGTWGPPVRLLSPPEVTVIDLIHGESE